jgi:cysteinyl-tRNA synthetase
LYNSLGRKLSVFKPMRAGEVRMYTCGPTVWNYAHIGNFRTFLFEDVLRRYLEFKGYRVIQVKNLTDVEDKIISGMKKTGKSLKELTEFYSEAFMQDLEALNMEKAESYPKATEHISKMVEMIKALVKSGYAYRADDGSTYFSIRKFKRYGQLSGVRPKELKSGARVSQDHYEKMGANDFALWKAWDDEDGEVFWETELGKGRPGWSIECSAMAIEYLGPSFDIHTGGKDLRFPHHENEIAQSEAFTKKRFARFWLHSEFLRVSGEEMHKSSGNIVTLRDLLAKGWDKRAVRLFLISGHYRDELNVSDESLAQAEANIERMDQFVRRLKAVTSEAVSPKGESLTQGLLTDFEKAMDDDLNVPKALAALFRFQRDINSLIDAGKLGSGDAGDALAALKKVDRVFGVMRFEDDQRSAPAKVLKLIKDREEARKQKDYQRADEIRAQLKEMGIALEDAATGTYWKKDV